MKVFNTKTRKKVNFTPLVKGEVKMYVCGPTVYDFGHLGHGRSAVSFDVVRRYFLYKGFRVKYVSNYTDIDDKMINRAETMGISVPELAEKVIPEYVRDYKSLGIMEPDFSPRATDYIASIIELIRLLEEKGHIYVISDGIYFDVSTFSDYGALSGQDLKELKAGSRKELNEEKRNHQDFVLWKFSKPGEPVWESPWGAGRPGWHIECSAMSRDLLGQPFDIHGGGADLTFPHHECELAQSCGAYECDLAKYWMHNGFIRIDNEKMSKSLGNFFTLRDIFKKYNPQAVRFLFLQTHYRSPIDFSHVLLDQASAGLTRVHDFVRRLKMLHEDGNGGNNSGKSKCFELLTSAKLKFGEAMDDDFETPRALAVCFDLIKDVNKLMDSGDLSSTDAGGILDMINGFDTVLGIFMPFVTESVDNETLDLIKQRDLARVEKDFKKADEIRDLLLKRGVVLEDSPTGTVWKKV